MRHSKAVLRVAKRHGITPDEVYSPVFRSEVHSEIDKMTFGRLAVFFAAVASLIVIAALFGR